MINIPETDKKRILIVGCGFAGLTLARKLKNSDYQVAIQQAKTLSVNLKRILKNKAPAEFRYRRKEQACNIPQLGMEIFYLRSINSINTQA